MISPHELWSRHPTWLVVISILWGAAGLSAQGKSSPKATPAEKSALPPPIFFLRDGSRITGVPGFDSLQVKTRYGVLKVPSSDLVRLRLTLRIEDDPDELIELEIQRLGEPEFEERETAMDALREFGSRALPYLEKLTSSADEELRNRCSLLIGEIKSRAKESNKHGDEFPALIGGSDEIITKRFKIRGSIQDSSFKIKSRYGILDIKIADILGVDFRSTGNIQETVSISGKQVVPGNWADTKLFVAPGTTLRIRASGNLLVKNYNLNSGPQGTTRYTGNTYKNFPMLSLVGKIGRKGTPFLIGANYKTITRAEGTLQLGVIPFRMNYTATGAYKVRVTTGE